MDVQKWLDETVQPDVVPIPPEHLGFESFMCPKKPDLITTGKRRRKRSKSDSSLLDPPSRHRKTPANELKLLTRESASEGIGSKYSNSIRSHSSESIISSQRYARKPRHKTRPERYNRQSKNVKEREKYAHRVQKKEVRNSRRRTKRKKGEILGNGIVQDFHTKNVSGDRLTLKPLEKLGIFNRGKTSIAVKGRGLPDLVFSEMKFLQKNKDQEESFPQRAAPKEKRKKEHSHTKEGEISAFFATAPPLLAEQNEKSRAKENRQDSIAPNFETAQHQQERLSVGNIAVPVVELPDKPSCLGFGTRRSHHKSTSYVSWSESVRAPSVISGHSRVIPVVNRGPFCSENRQRDQTTADGVEAPSHRHMSSLANTKTPYDVNECFRVSSIPAAHRRVSRSHSCPQHDSSPQCVNLIDRAEKLQSADAGAFPSSMPPFVPVRGFVKAKPYASTNVSKEVGSRTSSLSGANVIPTRRSFEKNDEQNDVETDPDASSSLDRVLQYCNNVFHEKRSRNTRINRLRSTRDSWQHATTNMYPSIQHIPTVQFSGMEAHSPIVPSFSGPNIYEQQAQRQQLPLQAVATGYDVLQDHICKEQTYRDGDDRVDYDGQDWNEFAEQYEFMRDEAEAYDAEDSYVTEDKEQQLVCENNVVGLGFWRPHKLY